MKGDVTVVTEEGASDHASLEDEVRYRKDLTKGDTNLYTKQL